VPEAVTEPRFTRGQKWAGWLSVGASIATIISLFLAFGGSSSSSVQPVAYPANVQANFLNACEANSQVTRCTCLLDFFQANVPLTRFEQDDALVNQGQTPPDVVSAENACP
jgi:hypothetical protein